MTKEFIQGSGGGGGSKGGGGSRTPTTAKDSLNNISNANILDVISEGEIEGIHDPGGFTNSFHQSIFLNNTPLKNTDGTDNFLDVEVHVRTGTPIQSVVKGFNKSFSPQVLGRAVPKDSPVTFTITDTSVTSVIIDIGLPALQKVNKLAEGGHDGAKDLATYWVGQGVGLMNQSISASDVVQEFKEDFAEAYERLTGFVS